jgi:acyl phosphate:glycerol-3-phosphate acyltransferase
VYIVAVVAVIGAYLLGTFPTAILVGRSTGHDPTREGSGNPGASNLFRTSGRGAGALVLAGDVAKGSAATGLGLWIDGRPLAYACLLAAIIGHSFPAFRRFRGGKGVATAGGGVIVVLPVVAAACLIAFAIVVKALKKASLGSLVMAVMVPLGAALIRRPGWEVVAATLVGLLIVARHRSNIRRLVSGTELDVVDAN